MTDSLPALLLRLSEEAGTPILWGRAAAPFFGPAFERLLQAGVLVERAPATDWPACLDCECGLEGEDRPIMPTDDGGGLAKCPLERRRDEKLDADDLRSFRLDVGALLTGIAKASGFLEEPALIGPDLWSLGVTRSGRPVFWARTAAAISRTGTVELILHASENRPVTLIGPSFSQDQRRLMQRSQIHTVAARDVAAISNGPLPIVNVERLSPEPVRPRLVIDASTRTATLDERKCQLTDAPFKLLWFLAARLKAGEALCSPRDFELSPGWSGRQDSLAISDAIRNLREQLAPIVMAPMTTLTLIQNRSREGYLLNLSAREVRLEGHLPGSVQRT